MQNVPKVGKGSDMGKTKGPCEQKGYELDDYKIGVNDKGSTAIHENYVNPGIR
jgi:hypothetical protein